MKKITIEIEVGTDPTGTIERRSVVAYDVAYPFAVHVSVEHSGASPSRKRRWSVTHVPSGLACGTRRDYKSAVALARKLATDRFWLTTVPGMWNDATRAEGKAKRDQAFAELGL